MTYYFTEVSDTLNSDGSNTHEVGAVFTVPALAPAAQTGLPLSNTVIPPATSLPFAGSAFNTTIPGSPTLDPNSAAIVSSLVAQWGDSVVGLNEITLAAHSGGFGAYYLSGQGQPTVPVVLLAPPQDDRRPSAFTQIPVPPQAMGSAPQDSVVGIWQPATNNIWELNQAFFNNFWFAQDATRLVNTNTGSGILPRPLLAGLGMAGISLWALSVKVIELQNGVINHALALSLPYVAPGFVAPAIGESGHSADSRAIQTGIKFQLIPGTSIASMSAVGQIVATALENYGAYVVGTNPNGLSILAEDPTQYIVGSTPDPYTALYGTGIDANVLNNIPVASFRVILHP